MKKKGFTLVELLAVIAILAILVIIALPNVLSMYNEARKNTFITEAKEHYNGAEQKFMLNAGETMTFTNIDGKTGTKLDIKGNQKTKYYIVFDASGDCKTFAATNGVYAIVTSDSKIKIEDIGTDKKGYTVHEGKELTLQVDNNGVVTLKDGDKNVNLNA